MKTFIVFTDFSKNARHASEYALQLAKKREARIELIHVFLEPVAVSEFEPATMHYQNMKERIMDQLEERKQALIERYGTQVPIHCTLYNHHLVERMQELFTQPEVKLAIIGLTGSGMNNFFFGSNTLDIVQRSQCTVLTVPPYSSFRPIKNIVFAYNTKDISPADIPVAHLKRILFLFEARLFILRINTAAVSAEEIEENDRRLTKMFKDVPHSLHVDNQRNVVAGIKKFSKDVKADLITIIPRKMDFWERILHTNHTKSMLFRSDIPILSVPNKSEGET